MNRFRALSILLLVLQYVAIEGQEDTQSLQNSISPSPSIDQVTSSSAPPPDVTSQSLDGATSVLPTQSQDGATELTSTPVPTPVSTSISPTPSQELDPLSTSAVTNEMLASSVATETTETVTPTAAIEPSEVTTSTLTNLQSTESLSSSLSQEVLTSPVAMETAVIEAGMSTVIPTLASSSDVVTIATAVVTMPTTQADDVTMKASTEPIAELSTERKREATTAAVEMEESTTMKSITTEETIELEVATEPPKQEITTTETGVVTTAVEVTTKDGTIVEETTEQSVVTESTEMTTEKEVTTEVADVTTSSAPVLVELTTESAEIEGKETTEATMITEIEGKETTEVLMTTTEPAQQTTVVMEITTIKERVTTEVDHIANTTEVKIDESTTMKSESTTTSEAVAEQTTVPSTEVSTEAAKEVTTSSPGIVSTEAPSVDNNKTTVQDTDVTTTIESDKKLTTTPEASTKPEDIMTTTQKPVYRNMTYPIIFEGDCGPLKADANLEKDFKDSLVNTLKEKIDMLKDKTIFVDELRCGSVIADVKISTVDDIYEVGQSIEAVVNDNLTVVVEGDNGTLTYSATEVEIPSPPTEPSTTTTTTTTTTTKRPSPPAPTSKTLTNVQMVLIIVFGVIGGSLLFVAVAVCCAACQKRHSSKSFTLGHTPKLEVNSEDFVLTKMDRPKPAYQDNNGKASDVRMRDHSSGGKPYSYSNGQKTHLPSYQESPLLNSTGADAHDTDTLPLPSRHNPTMPLMGEEPSASPPPGYENPSYSHDEKLDIDVSEDTRLKTVPSPVVATSSDNDGQRDEGATPF